MDANVDTCTKKLQANVASIDVEGKKSQQDLAVWEMYTQQHMPSVVVNNLSSSELTDYS